VDRAREYAFLLYAVVLAAAYAVIHDEVTVTISLEYFVYGKGLTGESLRWGVALLAVRASLPVGLLAGTTLLVANTPRSPRGPSRLPYANLMRLALVPLLTAVAGAGVTGAANAHARIGEAAAVSLGVPAARIAGFVTVWGVHFGSYAGGVLGIAVSAALVVVRRRAQCRSNDRRGAQDG
jgi:hypothetical protein